jgi:AcrR family transcriptional regulator
LKPGPGRSHAEVERDQRERIQRALIEIAAEGGYQAVTVRKLTKLAHVSPGAFYVQFDGKEDACISTYATAMASVRQRITAARSSDLGRRTQLQEALRVLVGSAELDVDSRQFTLVEVFGCGPAAPRRIRTEETALEIALKRCLDRRGTRVPLAVAGWVVAGSLRVARTRVLRGRPTPVPTLVERLMRWSLPYLEDETLALSEESSHPRAFRSNALSTRAAAAGGPNSEDRELILNATAKLVRRASYWSLSLPAIRDAAGVSLTRFGHQFRSVDDCYLATMRWLSEKYLGVLLTNLGDRRDHDWPKGVFRAVTELCHELAADPDSTRLLFVGILAPGREGLRCREELIGEWVEVWRRMAPSAWSQGELDAEATIAALWAAIAGAVEAGRASELNGECATFTFLLLAPILGADAGAAVVQRADFKGRSRGGARVVAAI